MNIIVAVDENYGIGCSGELLARIPEDTEFFRKQTLDRIVVMGRSTLKSLPGSSPLKCRTNIILTREKGVSYPGAFVCGSIKDFCLLSRFCRLDDVYVIGGQSVYEQFIPFCEYAYITKINSSFKADRFFPDIDNMKDWACIEQSGSVWGGEITARLYKYKNSNVKDIFEYCDQQ